MKKLTAFLLFLSCADFALGDYITTNVPNGCADAEFFSAMFEPNTYNCASGYYLPANTDGCRGCLSGYACSGGNFAFDEITNQGIVYKNPIVENVTQGCADDLVRNGILFAQFEPNSHTCSAGYYLPANVDECTQCPANSYCVGGTYSFNENTNQGIAACDNGYHSSAGASSCTPNTITINWSGADAEDIIANNAGQCTYGGDIRTPVKAQHIPGQTFVGWTFDVQ